MAVADILSDAPAPPVQIKEQVVMHKMLIHSGQFFNK